MSDLEAFCGPPLDVPGDPNVLRAAHDFLLGYTSHIREICQRYRGTFEKIVELTGLTSEQVVLVLNRPEDVSADHFALVFAASVHAH